MSDLKIITNNVPRLLIDAYELTTREREQFDYMNWTAIDADEHGAQFFRYKGELYDLGEFMHWTGPEFSPIAQWDGYLSDSFFSAIVVRFVSDDDDHVVVGLALS